MFVGGGREHSREDSFPVVGRVSAKIHHLRVFENEFCEILQNHRWLWLVIKLDIDGLIATELPDVGVG